MSFIKHYKEEEQFDAIFNEGIMSSLWKIAKLSISSLFGNLKPKTKKVKNFNPAITSQTTRVLFSHLHKLLASDLMLWKKQSRNKGRLDKFIMKRKDVYVVELYKGILPEGLVDDFQETFNLSDKFLINEYSIYKLSNGGEVSLVSVSDPYLGDETDYQVAKIDDSLKNLKYFVAIDKKAEKWFSDKTGMLFKQFMASRKNVTKQDLYDDLENMASTYEDPEEEKGDEETRETPPETPAEEKDYMTLPNGTKIYKQWTYNIENDKYNLLGFSIGDGSLKKRLGDEFKSHARYKNPKLDIKYYDLKNGGQISLINDLKNKKKFMVANDMGHQALEYYNIIPKEGA